MDTFYITDKGRDYMEDLDQRDPQSVIHNDRLLQDVTVLTVIDSLDASVFEKLKESDYRPTVRRLFEAGYIEKG